MARPKKPAAQVLPAGSLADETASAEDLPESFSKIVDVASATPEQIAALLRENADLQQRLAEETEARSEAEQKLVDQAAAQLGQSEIMEVPTGKTVSVRRLDYDAKDCEDRPGYKTVGYRDDAGGRPILKPQFKSVALPTFLYRIDLPPSGGEALKINGMPFYHGTVIEADIDTLRTLKEIVYRCWDHDRNITGSNENAYRKPLRQQISMKAVRA